MNNKFLINLINQIECYLDDNGKCCEVNLFNKENVIAVNNCRAQENEESEIIKGIEYYLFEEFLALKINNLTTKINYIMEKPLNENGEKQFSIREIENNIYDKNIDVIIKNKAKKILNEDISRLYALIWKRRDALSRELFKKSYLQYYQDFFGANFDVIYSKKYEILKVIQSEKKPQIDNLPVKTINSIKKDIVNVSNKLGIFFEEAKVKIEKSQKKNFSMYYTKGKVLLFLKEPNNYFEVQKVWHEFGHAIHYLKMDNSLNFVYKKIYDLRAMESMAILFELIGSIYNGKEYMTTLLSGLRWTWVEFFSLYEILLRLEFDYKKMNEIINKNISEVFGDSYKVQSPIRFINNAFKSYRYISSFFIVLGIFSEGAEKELNFINQTTGENILEFMRQGGKAINNTNLEDKGLSFFLNKLN